MAAFWVIRSTSTKNKEKSDTQICANQNCGICKHIQSWLSHFQHIWPWEQATTLKKSQSYSMGGRECQQFCDVWHLVFKQAKPKRGSNSGDQTVDWENMTSTVSPVCIYTMLNPRKWCQIGKIYICQGMAIQSLRQTKCTDNNVKLCTESKALVGSTKITNLFFITSQKLPRCVLHI